MNGRISKEEWGAKNPPRPGESFEDYVQRYEDETSPGVLQEAGSAVSNLARGGMLGLAKTGTSLIGGAGELVGSPALRRYARESQQQAEEFYAPEGMAGTVGEFVGRGAGEIATSLLGGAGVAKGLAKAAPMVAKAAPRAARGMQALARGVETGTPLQRALSTAAVSAPVDILQGAAQPEGMVLSGRGGAIAENVLLSGAGGALSGVLDARRAARELANRPVITDPRRMLPAAGQAAEFSGAPVPPARAGRGLPQVQQAGPVQGPARFALPEEMPVPTSRTEEGLAGLRRNIPMEEARGATPEDIARYMEERGLSEAELRELRLSRARRQAIAPEAEAATKKDVEQYLEREPASPLKVLQQFTEREAVRGEKLSRAAQRVKLEQDVAKYGDWVRNIDRMSPTEVARRLVLDTPGLSEQEALQEAAALIGPRSRRGRRGLAEAEILQSIAGGGIGGLAGYAQGDTEAERLGMALAGAAGGAALPFGIRRGARFFERGATPAAQAVAPEAMQEAQINIARNLRPGDIPPPKLDKTATQFPENRRPLVNRMGDLPFEQRQRIEELLTQVEPTLNRPMTEQSFYREVGNILGEKDVKQLLDIDPRRATAAEAGAVLSISRDMSKQRQAILQRYKSTIDEAEKAVLANDLDALDNAQARLVSHIVKTDRYTGQALASRRYMAKEITDPTYWYIRGTRVKGGNLLSKEEQEVIDRLTAKGDNTGLLQYMASLQKSSTLEQVAQLRAAGLLTAIPGRLRDVMSTSTNYLATLAQRYPNLMADAVASRLAASKLGGTARDFRTTLAPDKSELGAALVGVREGLRTAAQSMGFDAAKAGGLEGWVNAIRQAEIDENMAKQLDIPSLINIDMFGKSAVGQKANVFFDTYSKLAMRASGVTDKVIKAAALRGSLNEQARLIAYKRGLKGEQADQLVKELLDNPTQEMLLDAKTAADYITFTNDGAVAEGIAGAIERFASAAGKRGEDKAALVRAGARFLMPFRRTPANILTRMLEYAPGTGQIMLASSAWDWTKALSKAALDSNAPRAALAAQQRRAVDIFGRQLTGLSLFGLGSYLYKQGVLTGELPSNPSEQEQWRLEGKQPESLKIGNSWIPISRISPFGGTMTMAASMLQNAEEAGATGIMGALVEAPIASGLTVSRSLLNQPMVTGPQEALEALSTSSPQDAERLGRRFLSSMVGSFVPTGIAQLARAEGVQRLPQNVLQDITSRIPGLQETAPARLDIFGEPVQKAGGLVNVAINPLAATSDRTQQDPMVAEMARVKAAIAPMGRGKGEDMELYQYRQREAGKFVREDLTALMQSAEYQTADDDTKRELIKDTVTKARRDLAEYLKENYGIKP
jgi:hypothetical protein